MKMAPLQVAATTNAETNTNQIVWIFILAFMIILFFPIANFQKMPFIAMRPSPHQLFNNPFHAI